MLVVETGVFVEMISWSTSLLLSGLQIQIGERRGGLLSGH